MPRSLVQSSTSPLNARLRRSDGDRAHAPESSLNHPSTESVTRKRAGTRVARSDFYQHMTIAEWYVAREAEARRRIDWSVKLQSLVEPELRKVYVELPVDPVTNLPLLSVEREEGFIDLTNSYVVTFLQGGQKLVEIGVGKGAHDLMLVDYDGSRRPLRITDVERRSDGVWIIPAHGSVKPMLLATALTQILEDYLSIPPHESD